MTDPVEQKAAILQSKTPSDDTASSGGNKAILYGSIGVAALLAVFGVSKAIGSEDAEPSLVSIPEQERTLDTRNDRAPLLTGNDLEMIQVATSPAPSIDPGEIDRLEKQVAALTNAVEQNAKFQQSAMNDMERRLARINTRSRPGTDKPENSDELARQLAEEEKRLASQIVVLDQGQKPSEGFASVATDETGNKFLTRANNRTVRTVYAANLTDTHRLLPQGSIIPAILETAIASDLPGNIKARVRRDIWSADGSTMLIQRGGTLIGEYDANVQIGETRILVAWTRLITIDNQTINIGSPGTDGRGVAGFGGKVDNHFPEKFEAAAFISIFKGLSNLMTAEISTGQTRSFGSSGAEGLNNTDDAVEDSLEQYLQIPPTIWIDQGEQVNVFVNRDLYFSPS